MGSLPSQPADSLGTDNIRFRTDFCLDSKAVDTAVGARFVF